LPHRPQVSDLLNSPDISRRDKIVVLISALGRPSSIAELREEGRSNGLREIENWNVADYLGKLKGLATRVPDGWTLTTKGHARASELGANLQSPLVGQTAMALKRTIDLISDEVRKDFLTDTLRCLDASLNRPAVVYAWVGAVWILQSFVFLNHLSHFNNAGVARFNNGSKLFFRPVKSIDDFGRIKEADFLQLLEDISLIGKSFHKQLKDRLDLRNGSGHPNTMVVDEHTTAAHIHFLVENVYRKF
jgi:hypothetical protein